MDQVKDKAQQNSNDKTSQSQLDRSFFSQIKSNASLGTYGENLTCNALLLKGFYFKRRNYRTRVGEIDLIMVKDNCLYFIEVKTRRSNYFGNPEDAITRHKYERMQIMAEIYCQNERIKSEMDYKIWTISVELDRNGDATIKRFEN